MVVTATWEASEVPKKWKEGDTKAAAGHEQNPNPAAQAKVPNEGRKTNSG